MTTPGHVLVVGAGPTGLTLAAELAMAGVTCRVIDKRAEPSPHSRALGLLPRTLELLDQGRRPLPVHSRHHHGYRPLPGVAVLPVAGCGQGGRRGTCHGVGGNRRADPDLIITRPDLPLMEGASACLRNCVRLACRGAHSRRTVRR